MGKNHKKRHHSTQSSETAMYKGFALCGVLSKDSTNTPPTLHTHSPLQEGSKELSYGFVNDERKGEVLGECWWSLGEVLKQHSTPVPPSVERRSERFGWSVASKMKNTDISRPPCIQTAWLEDLSYYRCWHEDCLSKHSAQRQVSPSVTGTSGRHPQRWPPH